MRLVLLLGTGDGEVGVGQRMGSDCLRGIGFLFGVMKMFCN